MTRGLPGSGKTFWAREQVDKGDGKVKRVNKDDLRAMIDNGKWSKDREDKILLIRDNIIDMYLTLGFDVIVDDTNFADYHSKELELKASKWGAEFEIKDFDTDVDECILRDAGRPNPVGKKVILDMYNKYIKPRQKKVEYNPDLPNVYLCDIDGTLAIHNGRSPYDESKVFEDIPNKDVARVIEAVSTETPVIFVSGRHDTYRDDTIAWLEKYLYVGLDKENLLMRKADDNRPDDIVKEEIYNEHIKGKYNVLGVFDDRERVVKMWRRLGLTVFQVDEGRF